MPESDPLAAAAHSEVVLEAGAEGGSLTLLRERQPGNGTWHFWVSASEEALNDLLGEAAPRSVPAGPATSFEEALILLDKYAWARMHPVQVHPEFLDALLAAVNKTTGAKNERRWRDILALSAGR